MKVLFYKDNTYQVVQSEDWEQILFQGSLSDCESFIRLMEVGYL